MARQGYYGGQCITVGDNFYANTFLYLAAYSNYQNQEFSPEIVIGNNVHLNFSCQITAIHSVKLGNGILAGSNVLITDHTHGDTQDLQKTLIAPTQRSLVSSGAVKIGNNVLIGCGAVILPNVSIGDNSIIGANAVVTKSFRQIQ